MMRIAPALAPLAGLLLMAVAHDGLPAPEANAAPSQATAWHLVDTWTSGYDSSTMLEPTGMDTGPDGSLYVADTGHRRVARLQSGAVTGSIGNADVLVTPLDVAVDGTRGRVYVADEGGRQIAAFDVAGSLVDTWRSAGPDETFVPYAVAVDEASGDVFVLSSALVPRVERFRADGTWVEGWGSLGLGTGQFISPSDLAVDRSRKLLVADAGSGRIQLFDQDGNSLGQWSGLLGVTAIDTDPASGRTYALGGSTADRVVVVSALGSIEATLVGRNLPADQQWHPGRGLALLGPNRVAVSSGFGAPGGGHGVRSYATDPFAFEAAWVADPRSTSGFLTPTAIDVAADGVVHLLDAPIRVIRRMSPGGSQTSWLDSGRGDELEIGPAGEMYLADLRRGVVLRRIAPNGTWDWDKTCDCLSGMGLAATTDRVFATDGLSRTIQIFDLVPGRERPIGEITTTGLPYAWPADLDLDPTGRLWAVDMLASRLHIFDPSGTLLQSIDLPVSGQRISVGPDGTAFVLLLDGSVIAVDADGTERARWPILRDDGSPTIRPTDIAAGPAGRVYVLDGQSGEVMVYEPDDSPAPTPEPPPTGCSTTGTKTASPGRLQLGGEVTVTLGLDIRCAAGAGSEIVLILDRSSSMAGTGCNRLCDAKRAARGFVDNVDLTRHRVAVVSFADTAVLDIPLSSDKAAIQSAIDNILPAGNTNISAALATAQEHLAVASRPGSQPVVLLLTDGDPSGTEQAFLDALREGIRARARGGIVYSIGLGATVNATLLTAIAGAPERYFFAPRAEDLGPIYDNLAQSIGATVATELVIEDRMSPDVVYVAGSATGNPEVVGNVLTWRVGTSAGFSATYRVRPLRVGVLPTNELAFASYRLAGTADRFDFPVPTVDVWVSTPTATPTRTVAPTQPSPSSTPRPTTQASAVYLPILMKDVCRQKDRARGADVVLVIDTSSSMAGPKLAGAIAAGQSFVSAVDPSRDRVGLVSFDVAGRLEYVITAELSAVRTALAGLTTSQGTRIDLGVQAALREIGYRGRPGSVPVIVLLSDGLPSGGSEAATERAAADVRAAGISMYTIGLGADVDADLLARMASGDGRYLFAPTPDDLEAVYRKVVESLPCR